MGKEFHTAAKERQAEEQGDDGSVSFKIDGKEATAYRPTETQIALFSASFGRDATESDRTAALKDFLADTLDTTTYRNILARMRDRDDPFGFAEAMEILEWVMELFTDFPSAPSSDSTPSPKATGGRSTARAPGKGSTRSTSVRGGSAT